MYLINMKISCFCFSPLFIYLTHKRLKCICLMRSHVRKRKKKIITTKTNSVIHSRVWMMCGRCLMVASVRYILTLHSEWLWLPSNTQQYVRRMRIFFSSLVTCQRRYSAALKCYDYTIALCECALLSFGCDDPDDLVFFQLVAQHFSRS